MESKVMEGYDLILIRISFIRGFFSLSFTIEIDMDMKLRELREREKIDSKAKKRKD